MAGVNDDIPAFIYSGVSHAKLAISQALKHMLVDLHLGVGPVIERLERLLQLFRERPQERQSVLSPEHNFPACNYVEGLAVDDTAAGEAAREFSQFAIAEIADILRHTNHNEGQDDGVLSKIKGGLLYHGNDAYLGVCDFMEGGKNTISAVIHPIDTVSYLASGVKSGVTYAYVDPTGTATAVKDGIANLGMFAINHPFRFGTNILAGVVFNVAVGRAVGAVSGYRNGLPSATNGQSVALSDLGQASREMASYNKPHLINSINEVTKQVDYVALKAAEQATSQTKAYIVAKSWWLEKKQIYENAQNTLKLAKEATDKTTVMWKPVHNATSVAFVGNAVNEQLTDAQAKKLATILHRHIETQFHSFMQMRLALPERWCRKQQPMPHPENLVFQGGGPKGLIYVGALEELVQSVDLSRIKRVGGASSGAITAFLLSLGYSINEIRDLQQGFNMQSVLDHDNLREELFSLLKRYEESSSLFESLPDDQALNMLNETLARDQGIFPGESMRTWFEQRVIEKLAQYTQVFPTPESVQLATFVDLVKIKELYGPAAGVRELIVLGSNVTAAVPHAEVFSASTTPDALIVDAVRISMSIPLVFKPHRLFVRRNGQRVPHANQALYVDGGVFNNFPVTVFDQARYVHGSSAKEPDKPEYNERTLGIAIEENYLLFEAFLRSHEIPQRHNPPDFALPATGDELTSLLDRVLPPGLVTLARNILRINGNLQLTRALTYGAQQTSTVVSRHNWKRTVYTTPGAVSLLDFDLAEEEKEQLMHNGRLGVRAFVSRTNWM